MHATVELEQCKSASKLLHCMVCSVLHVTRCSCLNTPVHKLPCVLCATSWCVTTCKPCPILHQLMRSLTLKLNKQTNKFYVCVTYYAIYHTDNVYRAAKHQVVLKSLRQVNFGCISYVLVVIAPLHTLRLVVCALLGPPGLLGPCQKQACL